MRLYFFFNSESYSTIESFSTVLKGVFESDSIFEKSETEFSAGIADEIDCKKPFYKGNTNNGIRHGEGTYTYANGYKYIGGFVNDKFRLSGII